MDGAEREAESWTAALDYSWWRAKVAAPGLIWAYLTYDSSFDLKFLFFSGVNTYRLLCPQPFNGNEDCS